MSLAYLPWSRPDAFDDRPCVADEHQELTYREFARRVDAAAEQFAEHGVGAGSVVAVMLPNRVELLIAVVAAWRLGATATPINPVFTDSEAAHQIRDADAALLVDATGTSPDPGRPCLHVDDLRREPLGTPLPADPVQPQDLALLVYTSGSTGRPKGVMLTHANLSAMAASIVDALSLTGDDHCLLVLPLFHVNAICVSFLAPLLAGARLTVLQRFRPEAFLEAVEALRPTYFSAVPTIYAHLVALPEHVRTDTSSLRLTICGAAPAPATLLDAVRDRFGCEVLEGYGLTEGTCATTSNPLHGVRKPGTVGTALPGQRVAVMDPGGTLLPAGERGEIVVRGPMVMRGYLGRPEETARTLADGWLHTGDVGILDEDGYLTIVDRIKDMIIRGGENLYPKEIETVLQACASVAQAAVVGAPHAVYGEVPVAYLTPVDGATLDVDGVREHCARHLTKIKIPVAFSVRDTLPVNAIGKIDKPALRADAAAGAR
ncbi:AMP-binding protein [Streptomyces sp. SID5785]|uniref:class I adenylate-forming enzyme family protein n=1 Tax=Streptomyces sp. SID5785 TaxID=2690309 RepID=UPI0013619C8B|nr:AMP-binding protein [Streptomyces sp. SID5785]MZD04868.1 AMP-binding protein [Streptomyces sp. SID5785]